jgi:hypothetical protein
MLTAPDPVAKRCGGRDETATPNRVGTVNPMPIPVSAMPPSISPA